MKPYKINAFLFGMIILLNGCSYQAWQELKAKKREVEKDKQARYRHESQMAEELLSSSTATTTVVTSSTGTSAALSTTSAKTPSPAKPKTARQKSSKKKKSRR